jgi:hypothetical protein
LPPATGLLIDAVNVEPRYIRVIFAFQYAADTFESGLFLFPGNERAHVSRFFKKVFISEEPPAFRPSNTPFLALFRQNSGKFLLFSQINTQSI